MRSYYLPNGILHSGPSRHPAFHFEAIQDGLEENSELLVMKADLTVRSAASHSVIEQRLALESHHYYTAVIFEIQPHFLKSKDFLIYIRAYRIMIYVERVKLNYNLIQKLSK